MVEIKTEDELKPLVDLYNSLFNDLELFATTEPFTTTQPKIYKKYGKKLDNLVDSLERELGKERKKLDLRLARQEIS